MGRISGGWLVRMALFGPLVLAAAWLAAAASGNDQAQAGCEFGDGPPFAFQGYEGPQNREDFLLAQQLAATNQLFPENEAFALPEILAGSAGNRAPQPEATIPATLVHAIGWIESRTTHTVREVHWQSIGDVLLSRDCGYGVMQVTSYFENDGEPPSRNEALVGTHYAYNTAAGAQILVEKWNDAFFPIVGFGEPAFVESWYYALWAYNGWAFSNHPAGAETDPFRSLPYPCDGPRNGYAYQELVLGCAQSPPALDGEPLWQEKPVQLPDLASLSAAGGPLDPAVYFAGWNAIRQSPLGDKHPHPFLAMSMPLPPGALPVAETALPDLAARAVREAILGEPRLDLETTNVTLTPMPNGTRATATITVANAGSGLLVYRAETDAPWLGLGVQAGVAAGVDVPFRAGEPRQATITLVADRATIPAGTAGATVTIEALLPNGDILSRDVRVDVVEVTQEIPAYEAGQPQS
ncbi:MAG: hypothetical protein OXG19_06205 [Chloroflexi bacterium]|nr:hypothetical protein [Chloroflexota bacterium]